MNALMPSGAHRAIQRRVSIARSVQNAKCCSSAAVRPNHDSFDPTASMLAPAFASLRATHG
jgi:hypothetical protein